MFKGQFRKIKYHPVAKQTWPNPLAKAGCYIQPYVPEIEVAMRHFYNSLDEKGRRRYAGIEALKLGLGGRKPYTQHWENIDEKFLEVLHEHTAGDPMDVKVRWTDLTPRRDYDRFAGRSWRSGQSYGYKEEGTLGQLLSGRASVYAGNGQSPDALLDRVQMLFWTESKCSAGQSPDFAGNSIRWVKICVYHIGKS